MTLPGDWITTAGLIALTGLAVAATVLAGRQLRRGVGSLHAAIAGCELAAALLGVGLLTYRAVWVYDAWAPLEAHVDGLLLLISLLGLVSLYGRLSKRIRGMDLFLLPIMVVLGAWGICASWWTLRPFNLASVWNELHVVCVYLGMVAVVVSAAAAALYLYVQHRLLRSEPPAASLKVLGRVASLETVEANMVLWARAAFVLITVALITGVVVATSEAPSAMDHSWWYLLKIILAIAAWGMFAILLHIPASFRGRRAAVITLIGFVMVMVSLVFAASVEPASANEPHPDHASSTTSMEAGH